MKHIIAVIDESYIVGRFSLLAFLELKMILIQSKILFTIYQIGCIGGCIDRILSPLKERKCRIVGVDGFLGRRLENGSYSGVFGLLQAKKIGFYLKGEPLSLVSEGWLKRSLPVKSDK